MAITATVSIEPTVRQRMFHEAVAAWDQVGFGGARGPGKSFALCNEAIRQSLAYPGNLGAIVRKDLVDLRDTTMTTMSHDVLPDYAAQGLNFRWVGGQRPALEIEAAPGVWSIILWRDTKDEASLMSSNMGWLAIDEAIEVSEEFVNTIWAALGRRRIADGSLAPARMFWASNPGPGWCKRLFPVGPQPAKRKHSVDGIGLTRAYIPARPSDNPHNPPDYESKLRAQYPDLWVRRFVEGDWGAFEGQVFDEFDESIHVKPRRDLSRAGWVQILAHDWGFRNPAAALVVAIDFDGRFWVWREYRASGRTPEQHLPYLRELERGIVPAIRLIDPAAIDQSDGVSIGEKYGALGMQFVGWRKRKHGPEGSLIFVKNLLRDRRLIITDDCAGLIEEMKNARWTENTPAMAEKRGMPERMVDKDDHSIDCLNGAVEWYRLQPTLTVPSEDHLSRMILREARTEQAGNQLRREDVLRKAEPRTHVEKPRGGLLGRL